MSSDDEDYMSASFLAKCIPEKDVIPGLIKGHAAKRQHEADKKKEQEKKLKPIPKVVLESNLREEGLQSSIASDNKGFALLQKMGYKPGMGIGKEMTGIIEPIPIAVKNNRFGLGRENVLKEISQWKEKKKLEKFHKNQSTSNVDDYRKRIMKISQDSFNKKDLNTSQRVCRTLDTKMNILKPDEKWFWPEEPENGEEEEENGEEEEEREKEDDDIILDAWEMLKYLTTYLRNCHYYCVWCGIKYESEEDILSNCPGPTRDDH